MDEADILIIGGGSAGCVLASRLSENGSLKVTLVEAGDDTPPGAVPDDIADVFPRAYANPAYFWPDLRAVARAGSAERPYSQARIIGGGSTVMGMWALRGLPADYDNWVAMGAAGWGHDDVLPFFRKLERDLDITSPEHGADGPTIIRRIRPAEWPPFNCALAGAAERQGLRLLPDLNSTDVDGVYAIPVSSDGLTRVSAASAYLTEAVRRRTNLQVLPQVEVASILLEGRRAVGAVARRRDGSSVTLRARQVIVSAGAIHAPALLLRSGIGPASDLRALGIPVACDLPGVGRNLQNHVFTHLGAVIRPQARQVAALRSYAMAGARISSGLPETPGDIFLSFLSRASGYPNGTSFGMIGASLYAPFSRGSVTLDKTGPAGRPRIDFNLLADPRDGDRVVHGARFARSLLEDESVRPLLYETFVVPPNPPVRLLNRPGISSRLMDAAMGVAFSLGGSLRRAALGSVMGSGRLLSELADDAFDELALASVTPMFHPAGTCAIGSVVDPQARVHGVEGLRVVDASIMPVVPRANTNIPTIMVAEKCAAQILSDVRGG